MIMVLMLLCLQCMMAPGSVCACLLFMGNFVLAMIGEQGVLEALFSCDLVNFLRIFLYGEKEERRGRKRETTEEINLSL